MVQVLKSINRAACMFVFPSCVDAAQKERREPNFFDIFFNQTKWEERVTLVENKYKLQRIALLYSEILDYVRIGKNKEILLTIDKTVLTEQRVTIDTLFDSNLSLSDYPSLLNDERREQLDYIIIQTIAPFLLINFFRTINFPKEEDEQKVVIQNVYLLLSIMNIEHPRNLEKWVINTKTYEIKKKVDGANHPTLFVYLQKNFSFKRVGAPIIPILVEFESIYGAFKTRHFRDLIHSIR